jgi:hypothetical protein
LFCRDKRSANLMASFLCWIHSCKKGCPHFPHRAFTFASSISRPITFLNEL